MSVDPLESNWLFDPFESGSWNTAWPFIRSIEALETSLEAGLEPKEEREGDLVFRPAPTGSLSAMSFNYSA